MLGLTKMLKVCSAKMGSLGELVRHGMEHTKEGAATCSYCGQVSSSSHPLPLTTHPRPAPPSSP